MAKVVGSSCDVCGKLVVSNTGELPFDWIRVVLPHYPVTDTQDHNKDICSDKCLETLGRERRKASASSSPGTTDNKRSRMDSELADFMDARGIPKNARGPHVRMHTANGHEQNPVIPGCPICLFYTGPDA